MGTSLNKPIGDRNRETGSPVADLRDPDPGAVAMRSVAKEPQA